MITEKIEEKDIYVISLLKANHDKQAFNSESPPLDNYLKTQAGQDAKKKVTSCHVITGHAEELSHRILGYYTLSTVGIDVGELPIEISKKLPKYPRLPGFLLGRLAVDKNFRYKGIGTFLLLDAMKKCFNVSKDISAIALMVEAKDEKAIAFYKKFDFIELVDNKNKLFLSIHHIEKLFL
jgi:GNAT superfamily N-acetyltransferase